MRIGIDLVEISRVWKVYQRFPETFLSRMLHPRERDIFLAYQAEGYSESTLKYFLAGRFSAKEAYIKAIENPQVDFTQIAILSEPNGAPRLYSPYHPATQECHLSISHAKDLVTSTCLILPS